MRDNHGDQYDEDDPIIESQARPVGEPMTCISTAELAALQTRLAESEARASAFSKQQVTLVNEATVRRARVAELEAKLAESEGQRAVLVGVIEHTLDQFDRNEELHGDSLHQMRQALASQPPSDLVALVKAARRALNYIRHVVYAQARTPDDACVQERDSLSKALNTLLTNQPGWRALIESEGV